MLNADHSHHEIHWVKVQQLLSEKGRVEQNSAGGEIELLQLFGWKLLLCDDEGHEGESMYLGAIAWVNDQFIAGWVQERSFHGEVKPIGCVEPEPDDWFYDGDIIMILLCIDCECVFLLSVARLNRNVRLHKPILTKDSKW